MKFRSMNLHGLHLIMGLAAVAAFLVFGRHMRAHFPGGDSCTGQSQDLYTMFTRQLFLQ